MNNELDNLLWCIKAQELVNDPNRFIDSEFAGSTFIEPLEVVVNQKPELCQQVIEEQLAKLKTRRLGERFEAYWLAALELHPDFEVTAHNLAIRDQHKTLGELDFLVRHMSSGKMIHIELACKFYLLLPWARGLAAWVGPGLKDRLDKKYTHLKQHQLKLLEQPKASELCKAKGWDIVNSYFIMKGRLFTPLDTVTPDVNHLINTSAINGYWGDKAQLIKQQEWNKYQWMRLEKSHWLCTIQPDNAKPLAEVLNDDIPFPVQLAAFDGMKEVFRVFWVPDHWYGQALAQHNQYN